MYTHETFLSRDRTGVGVYSLNKHYLTGKVDENVPVFMICKPQLTGWRSSNVKNVDIRTYKLFNKEPGSTICTPLEKYMAENIVNNSINDFSRYKAFIDAFEEGFYKNINDTSLDYNVSIPIKGAYRSYGTYYDLNQRIMQDNYWTSSKLKARNYLNNLWFSAELLSNNAINPLFCLVAKRECIPYLRLCAALKQQPHPDSMEMWVRKDIMDRKSKHAFTNFRTNINKHLFSIIKANNIKIVEKDSLMCLFNRANIPTFNKLSDRKNWLNDIGVEVLEHLQAVNSIKTASSVELAC